MKMTAVWIAFLCTLPTMAFAQGAGNEWDALNQEAKKLYDAGKFDRALVIAGKALEVAEKNGGPDHPNVALSLNALALPYSAQGDYARAEPLLERALAIREKALGPDHPDVASCLNNLAKLYRATNRITEAKELEARAERIQQANPR